MTLSDNPALRSFVEGVHALFFANLIRPDDPLELFLDEVFGPRPDAPISFPTAEMIWAAFTADHAPPMELTEGAVVAYRARFPAFVHEHFCWLLQRPPWTDPIRSVALTLLRRHVTDPDAWRYLGLRFGFAADSTGTMTHEEIGRRVLRGKGAVDLAVDIAISTIRQSRDAEILRRLSDRVAAT